MKKIRKLLPLLAAMVLSSCGTPIMDRPSLMNVSPVPSAVAADEPITACDKLYQALNYDEIKAMWISYLELAPIAADGAEHFRDEFSDICSNCCEMGINTLFVHVRTFGDSFYPSELYPYTKAFGDAPFDALGIMVEEAHKRQLSIHAWINPLRCETGEVLDSLSDEFLIKKWYDDPQKYNEYIMYVEDTGHYWLDPALPEIRRLIADGAAEIVKNYEVDGVHIDDYFYPTTEAWFDAGVYVEQGSDLPFDKWRLENCNKMVSEIYNSVKSINSSVVFGIAPQGNIENNYNYMFADVKKWCTEEGYCDYICPQIYFGYENPYKPYAETVKVWCDMCSGKKLLIGIGAYKVDTEDEFINSKGIIKKQAQLALESTNGAALFSYKTFFGSDRGEEERKYLAEYLK